MAFDDKNEEILLFDEEEESGSDFLDDPNAKEDDTVDLIGDDNEEEPEPKEQPGEPSNQIPMGPRGLANQIPNGVQLGGFKTDVDIVFVIDCTGSMEPFLSLIKQHAKTLHEDIVEGLGSVNRQVRRLRLKVIAYRDYYYDYVDPDHPPMLESDFFTLPDDMEEYARFVDDLEYAGGMDEPESALEALHLAFNSAWQNDPDPKVKSRQIVMLFTDASAHKLEDPMRDNPEFNQAYPQEMPRSLSQLEEEYNSPEVFPAKGGAIVGHRLILFAPENMYPWNEMKGWDTADCQSMDPEKGLEGVSMDRVIDLIKGSIS